MVDLKLSSLGKQKIAILVVWFACLVGVRFLLGIAFSNLWIGTVGAVAVTFALFYMALVHTPLRRYRLAVNGIIQEWYKQKYLLYSVAVSASVIMTIIVFIEYGYAVHPEEIISLSDVTTLEQAQKHVGDTVSALTLKGHSIMDIATITAASVDKSLHGYYLKSASFVFAEHLEVIAFMLLARKSASLFS